MKPLTELIDYNLNAKQHKFTFKLDYFIYRHYNRYTNASDDITLPHKLLLIYDASFSSKLSCVFVAIRYYWYKIRV